MASLYSKGGAGSAYGGYGGSYGGMAPTTPSYGSDPAFRSSFGADPLSLYGSSSSYAPSSASWQQIDPLFSSLKRPADDVFYSGDALSKRPRYEMTQLYSPFPQRPGEKDCVFYMRTRTCSFGAKCKFDHPAWVPAGGIPDWKEVSTTTPKTQSFPIRDGEPDCAFFMKTGICKYGHKCKFNHPENREHSSMENDANENANGIAKTIVADSLVKNAVTAANGGDGDMVDTVKPASSFNAKGLPVRPGESDCSFYLKTGSCKFGSACRFNHPASMAIQQNQATVAPVLGGFTAPYGSLSLFSGGIPDYGFRLPPATDLGLSSLAPSTSIYPQRPGETTCTFYMKTGVCKFGSTCKFHHPVDRKEPATKVTLAGYPRREGEQACPFYMRTGTCKYALTCKFDHPPPGEAAAKALAEAGKAERSEAEEADD